MTFREYQILYEKTQDRIMEDRFQDNDTIECPYGPSEYCEECKGKNICKI